jgi:hypothetical protein
MAHPVRRRWALRLITATLGSLFAVPLVWPAEIRPLYEVTFQDMTIGGANPKGITEPFLDYSLIGLGGGVRVEQQFGVLLGVKGIEALTLLDETFKDPFLSYVGVGAAPVTISLLWFSKPGTRDKQPFVFGSWKIGTPPVFAAKTVASLFSELYSHAFPRARAREFPDRYVSLGAGYRIYSITPEVRFSYVPAWNAVTFGLSIAAGGIFDW